MAAAAAGLPNLVIAGAPRCGTSALYTFLAAHPEVAASSVKETQYFMDEGSALFHPDRNYHQHGLDGYRGFFTEALREKPDAAVVFEATPGYLYQDTAREVLPGLPSAPKLLFQLRKPSAQVYSSYLYSVHRAGNLSGEVSFREFAFGSERVAASKNEFHRHSLAFAEYETYLRGWREACGDERLRITKFESLRDDPRAYMRDLASWLQIDPDFYDGYGFEVVNHNVAVKAHGAHTALRRLSGVLDGRARRVARDLYRRVNTRPVPEPTPEERAVMAEIDARTEPASRELEERSGLDLRAWTTA
jgi:hypothetical protein